MAVRALAKNVGMSPYKVRRVTSLLKGRRVEEALELLRFMPSLAAREVEKVLKSAGANAENNLLMDPERTRITYIDAHDGPRARRMNPRARGRADVVRRRSCRIVVLVDEEAS
ncbi:MAG: 50S ribosomal protein L22 [Chloroflexi bacterium]|nr:50S ribosomal protein L22 [Chloroflexota bacterium]